MKAVAARDEHGGVSEGNVNGLLPPRGEMGSTCHGAIGSDGQLAAALHAVARESTVFEELAAALADGLDE
jgi:hypothetical protein